MSRFRAELVISLVDGSAMSECFNQAQMAAFTRERMLARLAKGLPVVIYDGDRIEIPATLVHTVSVVVQDAVAV